MNQQMRKLVMRDRIDAFKELSGTSRSACLERNEPILSDNICLIKPKAPEWSQFQVRFN